MDLPINPEPPLVMHIDLNGAFATIEQQANRHLRGKAIGVAANPSERGTIISPSYEAKAFGVRTGHRVFEARELYPKIQILHADPDKYFYVHKRFAEIFREYSSDVTPLSIDEAAINFAGTEGIRRGKTLAEIGYEIKNRIRSEIGEWISCNVGIGTNRFLAKTAADLHKPDGLDVITDDNLRDVYEGLELIDLCGINVRYEARLNLAGIRSPLEFLDSPVWKLKNEVFKSIVGYYWYLRLRGYEIDTVVPGRKSYGQSYHLHKFTAYTKELAPLLMKLTEKMGRRLRRAGMSATGVEVALGFRQGWWHESRKSGSYLHSTFDLYEKALELMEHRPPREQVTHMSVACFGLIPLADTPLSLFDTLTEKRIKLAKATDDLNNRFGEYLVHPAQMMGLENEIVKRVPFHATTDTLSEIYEANPDPEYNS